MVTFKEWKCKILKGRIVVVGGDNAYFTPCSNMLTLKIYILFTYFLP